MKKPNSYLSEIIEYGGDFMTRAEVIASMQAEGTPQPLIDRWLQGQELARKLQTAGRDRGPKSVNPPRLCKTHETRASSGDSSRRKFA